MSDRDLLIHDHDGHIDDLISLGILATAPGRELVATTLVPADSYLEPATKAVEKLLTLLGKPAVHFAINDNAGTHPFPDKYRKDSHRLPGLPIFSEVREATIHADASLTAPQYLAQRIAGMENYEIVETGPLTNIAEALRLNPKIAKNVSNLFVMGGALTVGGNVFDESGHDGSAEWNFYNNPRAARDVLKSGIPITLVSLDITNEFPVTEALVRAVKKQPPSVLSLLAYESWNIILAKPAQAESYFMWDMLTAAICLKPTLFDFRTEKISIDLEGSSSGRTRFDPHGDEVRVPVLKDRKAVVDFIFECLRQQ